MGCKDIVLEVKPLFKKDVREILAQASKYGEAVHLAMAAAGII